MVTKGRQTLYNLHLPAQAFATLANVAWLCADGVPARVGALDVLLAAGNAVPNNEQADPFCCRPSKSAWH